jgi:hypothetical protein
VGVQHLAFCVDTVNLQGSRLTKTSGLTKVSVGYKPLEQELNTNRLGGNLVWVKFATIRKLSECQIEYRRTEIKRISLKQANPFCIGKKVRNVTMPLSLTRDAKDMGAVGGQIQSLPVIQSGAERFSTGSYPEWEY